MTKINTINPKGDTFLVHTDDYDIQFNSVSVTIEGEAGDVLEDAGTKVSATTESVLGILVGDTDGTGKVRVMTRGNPSSVDRKKLNYNGADEADIDALLNDKGIVVINNQ